MGARRLAVVAHDNKKQDLGTAYFMIASPLLYDSYVRDPEARVAFVRLIHRC